MSDQGVIVFGDSGSATSKDLAYDSRRGRLQANLTIPKSQPPHLKIIDDFPGGSPFVSVAGSTLREVLYSFKHNLPYTPEFLPYIYVKSYGNSSIDAHSGTYAAVLFYSGFTGTIEDKVFWEVDEEEIRLVHELTDYAYGSGYVSDAPKYLLRIKYYILSNDSHVKSYNSFGTLT